MTRYDLLPALAVVLLAAPFTHPAAIEVSAYAWTDGPGGLSAVVPGELVYYQIGVAVDPDFDPLGQPSGNRGLATIFYDMISLEAEAQAIPISPQWDAPSGYTNYTTTPILHTNFEPMYVPSLDGSGPAYEGGWGFSHSGLPTGGNTTTRPGSILGAGGLMMLAWGADADPLVPGLQPQGHLDVGHGLWIFPDDDPILGGMQGGLGMSIDDPDNIVEGDGTWVIKQGYINTTHGVLGDWAPGTYHYDLIPTNGALLSGTADYNQDLGGGFRVAVDPADMTGDSFAFTIIPEPATATLLLLAAATALRRRS